MSNLLFISDLHGVGHSAEQLEKICSRLDFGTAFVLGDSLEPFFSAAAIRFFDGIKDRALGVRGNCDDPERVDASMPFDVGPRYLTSTEAIPGHELFCSHGDLWNSTRIPPQGDIIVFGHSHIPMLARRELPGEEWLIFFNPGSAGLPRGGNPASFGFFDEKRRMLQIRTVEDGSVLRELPVG